MENLVEKTIEEISAVFEKAVQEAYESGLNDGRKTVPQLADKPVETKTVNRKARIGERILITSDESNGKTYTVSEAEASESFWGVDVEGVQVNEDEWAFVKDEYEVIIEDNIPLQDVPVTKTPNQQRFETIQWARGFVEGLKRPGEEGSRPWEYREDPYKNSEYGIKQGWNGSGEAYNCEFVVNREERTVVAILRGYVKGKVIKHGVGKCHPSDVFNADIGKAIALARALEIEIPQEFLNAVQPDLVVAGMDIKLTNPSPGNEIYYRTVKKVNESVSYTSGGFDYKETVERNATIIDDTNAIYNVEGTE